MAGHTQICALYSSVHYMIHSMHVAGLTCVVSSSQHLQNLQHSYWNQDTSAAGHDKHRVITSRGICTTALPARSHWAVGNTAIHVVHHATTNNVLLVVQLRYQIWSHSEVQQLCW